MGVVKLLLTGLELLILGMAFVFLFLGLLMVVVNLIAKYMPVELPVTNKNIAQPSPVTTHSETSAVNPKLIAAITAAVHQYQELRQHIGKKK